MTAPGWIDLVYTRFLGQLSMKREDMVLRQCSQLMVTIISLMALLGSCREAPDEAAEAYAPVIDPASTWQARA